MNDQKTGPLDNLIISVKYFRSLGFFSQEADLSNEQLVLRIFGEGKEAGLSISNPSPAEDVVREDTGDPEFDAMIWRSIRPRPDYPDWNLVSRDKSRVWWEDGEGDITPGDEVYVCTLMAWSRISRGTFLPTNAREVWHKPKAWPECKVKLEFLLNGRKKLLEPWDSFGWIDYSLIESINKLIAKTGFAYYSFDTQDQTTGLVVLTSEEKHRLVEERNWKFLGDPV